MAVSPNKIRIKVTMYKELATLILADAERLHTTRSELITKIVTEHYEKAGQYQDPVDAAWKARARRRGR